MSPGARRSLVTGVLCLAVVLIAAAVPFAAAALVPATGFIVAGIGLLWLTVGSVIVARVGNRVGWVLMVVGLATAVSTFTVVYTVYGWTVRPGVPGFTLASVLGEHAMSAVGVLGLLFMWFPDGRPPGQRWRWAAWAIVGGVAIAIVGTALLPQPLTNFRDLVDPDIPNPIGVHAFRHVAGPVAALGVLLAIAGTLAAIASLVVRFRRSSGEERQQMRWLAYVGGVAAAILAAWVVASVGLGDRSAVPNLLFSALVLAIGVGVPTACAIAVLRYRLYDLDVVIEKTVVFGVLALFITATYAVAVAGIGALVSRTPALGYAAAAFVAVAFQPVRVRARRLADRLVCGERATPYEVLGEFSDRMSQTVDLDEALPQMARILAGGTGADRATIWLRSDGDFRIAATWPQTDDEPPERPGGLGWFEVRHRGEVLGAIDVRMPASDPMNGPKAALIEDVASQAALVMRNVALLEDIRASRQRLVAAEDDERRQVERSLRQGVQPILDGVAGSLRNVRVLVPEDPTRAKQVLVRLQGDVGDALDALRELARGIYPPLLADQGLEAALQAQIRRSPVPAVLEGGPTGRYAQDVEATVYFCCVRALQDACRRSRVTLVTVRLGVLGNELRFEVTDDGLPGDPGSDDGADLTNMNDRLEALGGWLAVRSIPGAGTSVDGGVPIAPERTPVPPPDDAPRERQEALASSHAASSRSGPKTDFGM